MKPIYLDYNATTPIDNEVAEAMRPYLDTHFGNPSSSHWYGKQTKAAVKNAREQVAMLLGCDPDEVIFTSGGTESNNHAIKGAALAYRSKGNHIITSAIEHPAVTEVCGFLETCGFNVTYLPVDGSGLVDPAEVEKAITQETILVTIMHANNEVGTIQPIERIAETVRQKGIILHTDAAQSVGKIPVRVDHLGVDLLSIAGHKVYAPKGIGALFIRRGTKLQKFMHGADHEMNLRAGTENVLEIVGLGKACEIAVRDLQANSVQMKKTRDRLEKALVGKIEDIRMNGHPEKRLPNTLSVSFANLEAEVILAGVKGIAASAGAACHSGSVNISSVLTAMKVPMEYATGTIRFSTGRGTTVTNVEEAAEKISEAVKSIRAGE